MVKDKEKKSVNVIIRVTPKEKEKLLEHCKEHKCKIVDLFRPKIERIAKKK